MRNTDFVSNPSAQRGRHFSLVHGAKRSPAASPVVGTPPDISTVRQLTHAMMNRLWIPHTTTLVGLLGVGLSRTNFDELSKWIVTQLATVPDGGAANQLPRLERDFRRAVDRFPEL